jgi:hypothetical protein
MKLVCQELIRMLRFDSPGIEFLGRKILEIDRHDEIGTTLDRGGENMAIIGVGAGERAPELCRQTKAITLRAL